MKLLKDLSIHKDLPLNLFSYADAIAFLKDYIHQCQQKDKRYSFRYFARRLGVSSPDYVQRLLQKKRSISEALSLTLVTMMDFNAEEKKYFELLRRLAQEAPTSQLRKTYERQVKQIRLSKLRYQNIEESQLECITSWLHLVLLEMVNLKGAHWSIPWFQRCLKQGLKIKAGQLSQYLNHLKQAQLLSDEDGELDPQAPVLSMADEKNYSHIRQFHQEAIEHSLWGLDSAPASQREYGSVIVSTTPEKFKQAKALLKQFRMELGELLDCPPNEASLTTSFSFQFFIAAETPEQN